MNVELPFNIPFACIILGVGEAIAHNVHFAAVFWVNEGAQLIYPHAVVFPREVNYKGIQRGLHFVQPLFIAFFNKCLAHIK